VSHTKGLALPAVDYRTCSRCLYDENSPDLKPECPDDPKGRHRLTKRYLWFGVIVDDWFGVRSAKEAREVFGQACYASNAYLLVKRFTDAEVQALREGTAALELTVRMGE